MQSSTVWTGRRVLVTGALGFLGANVAGRLAQLGADVIGVVHTKPSNGSAVRLVHADVLDRRALHDIFERTRPEIVFHLAGMTNAGHARELVLPEIESNLISTVVVMSEALDSSVAKVIVTGSLEEPVPGQAVADTLSPYAASKWATSVYARMYRALYELPVTIVRPYMTYGPHQNSAKLIPYLVLNLLRGDTPSVSQPDRTVDWVYVDDVVDGLLAAALEPRAVGRSIDFGTGELVSIREVVRRLERILDVPGRVDLRAAAHAVGVAGRRANTEDAANLLGWKAMTPLETGLRRTVSWFRERLSEH